jgi:hypothetical protein
LCFSFIIGCFVVKKLKQIEWCFISVLYVMYKETCIIVYIERICENPDKMLVNKFQLYLVLMWRFTLSESRITKVVKKLVNMEEDKVTIYFIP